MTYMYGKFGCIIDLSIALTAFNAALPNVRYVRGFRTRKFLLFRELIVSDLHTVSFSYNYFTFIHLTCMHKRKPHVSSSGKKSYTTIRTQNRQITAMKLTSHYFASVELMNH